MFNCFMMLNPRHILITGASSGIGAALASLYAGPGITLSLQGRNAERLEKVASIVRTKNGAVHIFLGDVTDYNALANWIKTQDVLLPLDLVVANAGISAGSGNGMENPQLSHDVFATNVTGVQNTVHAALPLMLQRKSGQIALMASLASFRGFAGAASYCGSKAAVRVYGEGLRADAAPHGVAVNVICPGYIKTPLTDRNMFPMPFIMTAERAALIIRKGLAHNKARIAFPLPMYLIVRLASLLPQDFLNKIMWDLPKKGH